MGSDVPRLVECETFLARHFVRSEPRMRALDYLDGLLSDLPKKSAQQVANQAQHRASDGVRWLLTGAVWDADGLRDDIREHVYRCFHDDTAAFVVDDVGFVKRGDKSAGVAIQYNPDTGRAENCQLGVFAALATRRGRALIDRELYLPVQWADAGDRRQAAGIPHARTYRSRTALACDMIDRARHAGVRYRWVVTGRSYGDDPNFRGYCAQQGLAFVVEVSADQPLPGADGRALVPRTVLARLPARAFERRAARWDGFGPGWDWAAVDLADAKHRFQSVLLIGRPTDAAQPSRFFLCRTPGGVTLGELVHVAGLRTAVAECTVEARHYAGLDQYEVRKYVAWYRHVTLAMLACATLAVWRAGIDGQVPRVASAAVSACEHDPHEFGPGLGNPR